MEPRVPRLFGLNMLLSLGLPDNLCIIAWGLFLEHLIMINYGINSIQELVDHKVNLQVMCDSPLCRLNLEQDFQVWMEFVGHR